MAGVTQGRAGRGGIVGINVTPMVDVVLVLLIIMMVSATYIVSQSLKVELPKTASSDETVAKTYVVTVTKEGNYFYNDKSITRDGLQKEFRAALAAT
ncbi:MAG: biopolymer transporter ExbD, partial [Polyangiaceae bacterium]